MPLTIELGTPTVDADSFVDQTYLTEYFDKRGYVLPAEIDQALVLSFQFMKGSAFDWCASHDVAFDVTDKMKQAQCEVVVKKSLLDKLISSESVSSNIKSFRDKTGPLDEKTEYFEGKAQVYTSKDALKEMSNVTDILGSLLCGSSTSGASNFSLVR